MEDCKQIGSYDRLKKAGGAQDSVTVGELRRRLEKELERIKDIPTGFNRGQSLRQQETQIQPAIRRIEAQLAEIAGKADNEVL
jgi:C4-dicarboxylate-specific signal transduction histidine kinase